jgi:hypothetical protein
VWQNERVPLVLSTATRVKDKAAGRVASAAVKVLVYYAPQWM